MATVLCLWSVYSALYLHVSELQTENSEQPPFFLLLMASKHAIVILQVESYPLQECLFCRIKKEKHSF